MAQIRYVIGYKIIKEKLFAKIIEHLLSEREVE